jgi:hypothetical protein
MTDKQFLTKLEKKFPYAYSLIPKIMWIWIFNNLYNDKVIK